jgi:Tat protein secretion system quality control protein TatD with DNase activity
MSVPVIGDLEFGDSHGHLCSERPDEWADVLARNMAQNRVRKATLCGAGLFTPDQDDSVLRAYERHSDAFIPFICQVDPDDLASKAYIDKHLERDPWAGIGEIFLDTSGLVHAQALPCPDGTKRPFRYPVPKDGVNCEVFRYLFDKCAEVGKPVWIHCERALPLWTMLKKHPRTKVIWAHADYVTPPEDVRHLLKAWPNLTCDFGPGLRIASSQLAAEEKMPSVLRRMDEWKKITQDYPDRLTLGTDLVHWTSIANYGRIYELYRGLLKHLSLESARKISYGNFQRIFGIPDKA